MTKVMPWPKHAAVAYSFTPEVNEATMVDMKNNITRCPHGMWHTDILDASAASAAALVAPHLAGGQLKGKVTFADVDLV
ncbi:hypothetical protein FOA52_014582 [Chlamydomonas sp. UWO 241]|nr:hypothetical protein FOA52_014582 [Chlamydomonas sp. UWO 241]